MSNFDFLLTNGPIYLGYSVKTFFAYSVIFNEIKEHVSNEDYEKYKKNYELFMKRDMDNGYYYYYYDNENSLFDFKYFRAVYSYEKDYKKLIYFEIEYCEEFDRMIHILLHYKIIKQENVKNISSEFFNKNYDFDLFKSLKYQSNEDILYSLRRYPSNIAFVQNPNYEHFKIAINHCSTLVTKFENKLSEEDLKNLILEKNTILKHVSVSRITYDICKYVVSKNKETLNYIVNDEFIKKLFEDKIIDIDDIIKLFVANNKKTILFS